MIPAGQLQITLRRARTGLRCNIVSTRPLAAAGVFSGKPVAMAINTVPLLFNVCARAQASSLVRAVESAQMREVSVTVASQREALVLLESLREQLLRILLDWPRLLGDDADAMQQPLATVLRRTVALADALHPERLFAVGGARQALLPWHTEQWQTLAELVQEMLFSNAATAWLARDGASIAALRHWTVESDTVAARFLDWLWLQPWRHAGASAVTPPPAVDDAALAQRLCREGQAFTAQPEWRGSPYDMSWFRGVATRPLVAELLRRYGNGIFTRCAARLVALAETMARLDDFFLRGEVLAPPASMVPGMAHTEAARGRLTHLVELEGERIERLLVLAPTEWNFHPQGVAARGLENLRDDGDVSLEKEAELLIHAIDPCVDYALTIDSRWSPINA